MSFAGVLLSSSSFWGRLFLVRVLLFFHGGDGTRLRRREARKYHVSRTATIVRAGRE